MSMKIVVTDEQVTKVARTSIELQSGEIQKRVTVTLESGVRVVMKEGEALYQRVGRFVQQGDIMSFTADDFNVSSFKPEGGDREIKLKEVLGLKDVTVKAGIWSDDPIEGLGGREAVTDDKFSAPRTRATAPPVSGAGQFIAPEAGATANAATGTDTGF